jgi:hypothetical protein
MSRRTLPNCLCTMCVASWFIAAVPFAEATVVFYSDINLGIVYRTDGTTTTPLVTGLNQPMKIVLVGDGSFYVGLQQGRAIRHYSASGFPIGAAFGVGTVRTGMTLGTDGKLYAAATDVLSSFGYVDRYNLDTNSAAPSSFADHGLAQYTQYSAASYFEGLAFGPDGHLYASGNGHSAIDVYQGPGEASPGAFIQSMTGAGHSYGITFGPDGQLYASNNDNNIVYRYNGASFAPFVTSHLSGPIDPVFGPDGSLYVTNYNSRSITRYQGPGGASPGAFINVFANIGTGGNPSYMAIAVPEPAAWMMIIVGGLGLLTIRGQSLISTSLDRQLMLPTLCTVDLCF